MRLHTPTGMSLVGLVTGNMTEPLIGGVLRCMVRVSEAGFAKQHAASNKISMEGFFTLVPRNEVILVLSLLHYPQDE